MEGTAVNLKTYQAYSMAEALAAVKRDLGADAIILNTRSFRRGGLLGLGGRTIVELTASANTEVKANEAARARISQNAASARMAAAATPGNRRRAQRAYGGAATPVPESGPDDRDRDRTRRLAQAMLEQHRRRGLTDATPRPAMDETSAEASTGLRSAPALASPTLASPTLASPTLASPTAEDAAAAGSPTTCSADPCSADPCSADPCSAEPHSPEPAAPVARRFLLSPPPSQDRQVPPAPAPAAIGSLTADIMVPDLSREWSPSSLAASGGGAVAVADEVGDRHDGSTGTRRAAAPRDEGHAGQRGSSLASPDTDAGEDTAVRAELGAIRKMVCEVLRRQTPSNGGPTPTMPERLFDMYLKLIGQEVSEELADQVINEVRDELTAMELEDEETVRSAVCRSLADFIPTADEAPAGGPRDGRPLTIVLIGPTGVGKTTTLAKVAASFKLRHGRKVGLITADTYRIAAVDQLRTYASIIGLPLKVALTPSEMGQAVLAMSDLDVILIDTAGRGQNDAGRIAELKRFVDAAQPHEVHLVLSSTAGESVLMREAEAFGTVGVDKVVLTKLDEAVSFGMLVNVVRKIGKNLSFFTTGQEVPDQIEVSRPERLAELILGGDVHA